MWLLLYLLNVFLTSSSQIWWHNSSLATQAIASNLQLKTLLRSTRTSPSAMQTPCRSITYPCSPLNTTIWHPLRHWNFSTHVHQWRQCFSGTSTSDLICQSLDLNTWLTFSCPTPMTKSWTHSQQNWRRLTALQLFVKVLDWPLLTQVYFEPILAMFPELSDWLAPTTSLVSYLGFESAIPRLQKKAAELHNEEPEPVRCLTIEIGTTHKVEVSSLLLANTAEQMLSAESICCAVYMNPPFQMPAFYHCERRFLAARRACGDFQKTMSLINFAMLMILRSNRELCNIADLNAIVSW